jgi:ubiquinone/menaquinone biosynthesis C-methylase UbiE
MHAEIFNTFSTVSDEEWTNVLLNSVSNAMIESCVFPGFPDAETQTGMIGSSGVHALYEPRSFYTEIRKIMKNMGKEFDSKTKLLDFATGYGRVLRFFLKDIHPGNLVGSDVRPDFIDICRSTFGNDILFEQNEPYPPLRYDDNEFDIITAYSLFSHFSEYAHKAWLKEFKRVLKPNGMLFITLRQEEFLEHSHFDFSQSNLGDYDRYIAANFGTDAVKKKYKSGEYIYIASGGGGNLTNDFYGDTVIPHKYIKRNWNSMFKIVEHFDRYDRLPQAFYALQPKK